MEGRRKKFRTRSWYGLCHSREDVNYVLGLKMKYVLISGRDEDGWRILIQFRQPRARPATKATIWVKPDDIRTCLKEIDQIGEYEFKAGQLDVWTANPGDMAFIRTDIGAEYWKEQ